MIGWLPVWLCIVIPSILGHSYGATVYFFKIWAGDWPCFRGEQSNYEYQFGACKFGILLVAFTAGAWTRASSERAGHTAKLIFPLPPANRDGPSGVAEASFVKRFACTAPFVVRGPSALVHGCCIDNRHTRVTSVACIHPPSPDPYTPNKACLGGDTIVSVNCISFRLAPQPLWGALLASIAHAHSPHRRG
jgi:hypothetical protein